MGNLLLSEKKKLLRTLRFFILFLFVLLLLLGFKKLSIFPFLLKILKALLPFWIGLLLAFFFEPVMQFLEKKMPKICAVLLPFLFLCLFLLLLGIFIVPSFLKEAGLLFQSFPKMIEEIQEFLEKLWIFKENPSLKQSLFPLIQQIPSKIQEMLALNVPSFCSHFLSILTTSFFSILIGIYLLCDFKKIKKGFLKLIPKAYRKETKHFFQTLRQAMNRYFLGVFLVVSLVFVTQLIGFFLAGMRSPIFFASLCALTDFIPYIGPYIGGIPCVLVALRISPTVGFFTLLSILVVQILENSFYQPYILGKTVYLPPWLLLTGIVFASSFFGLLGMLLVTPTLLFLKISLPFLGRLISSKA